MFTIKPHAVKICGYRHARYGDRKADSGAVDSGGIHLYCPGSRAAGAPDFALPDYRCVIFTHGCFWHHHDCYLFKVPATRTAFWLDKIAGNVARDARDRQKLAAQGWRVLIVWECALRGRLKLNDEALTERLEEWICGAGHDAQIDTQGIRELALISTPYKG